MGFFARFCQMPIVAERQRGRKRKRDGGRESREEEGEEKER